MSVYMVGLLVVLDIVLTFIIGLSLAGGIDRIQRRLDGAGDDREDRRR